MKNKLYWLLIVFICVSMLGAQPTTVLAADREPPNPPTDVPYVPGEVIVGLNKAFTEPTMESALVQGLAATFSGEVLQTRNNAILLKVDESTDIPSFVANFKANVESALPQASGQVEYAEPNYIFDVPEPPPGTGGSYTPPIPRPNHHNGSTNADELRRLKSTAVLPTYPEDPLLFNTWGWWNSNTDVVWQDKSASPMICLLDTGVDIAHPDLVGMVVNGKDVVNNDAVPDDDNGHGTVLAGIMAAKTNNKVGLAGVSNSKILAIKVLNSVGSGNAWDIGDGIRLCADNTSVKLINMSFGSYGASTYIYDALYYAIVGKGKLAVAAAGNSSTSFLVFPAAWGADFVCSDGSYYPDGTPCLPPDPVPNYISSGLISVGAGRSYWSTAYDTNGDGYLWVDVNGDHNQITDQNNPNFWNEHFFMSDCAASFSNFGAWVNIVAPGENVTSTVPVSYPFFQQYNWGADPDGDGYDTWDGTSMAAPFVTASAARVWSIGSKLFGTTAFTSADVKNRIISNGYLLQTAVDPNISPMSDGYYGTYSGEAPYCWPNASKGVFYDMSSTRILNLSDAMNRTTVYAYIFNAVNGLPLRGAVVGAFSGTAVVSAGLLDSNTSPVVVLPNIPRDKTYDIKVNRPGFTNGPVTISQLYIPTWASYLSDGSISVSIPPMGKVDGVIDWIVYDPDASDLDMYAWLPTYSTPDNPFTPNPDHGGVIGWGVSTPSFIGNGRLSGYPFARWNHDGGLFYDWSGTESISIMPKPGSANIPYYNRTGDDYYDFIIHEYETGALNANQIYFRLWNGGKVKATVLKTASCDTDGPDNILGNSDDETWWEPGFMWSSNFYLLDICGKADAWYNGGLWPYTIAKPTQLHIKPSAP